MTNPKSEMTQCVHLYSLPTNFTYSSITDIQNQLQYVEPDISNLAYVPYWHFLDGLSTTLHFGPDNLNFGPELNVMIYNDQTLSRSHDNR